MDLRKLVLGLTALAIVAGLLLVSLAPGGWFNKGQTEKAALKTPVGSLEITSHEAKSSAWPTVGMYCAESAELERWHSYLWSPRVFRRNIRISVQSFKVQSYF